MLEKPQMYVQGVAGREGVKPLGNVSLIDIAGGDMCDCAADGGNVLIARPAGAHLQGRRRSRGARLAEGVQPAREGMGTPRAYRK